MSGLRLRLVLATTALALSLFCSSALAAASGCPYSGLWGRISSGLLRPWSGSAAVSNHMDAQRAAAAAIDFKAVRVRGPLHGPTSWYPIHVVMARRPC